VALDERIVEAPDQKIARLRLREDQSLDPWVVVHAMWVWEVELVDHYQQRSDPWSPDCVAQRSAAAILLLLLQLLLGTEVAVHVQASSEEKEALQLLAVEVVLLP
jgi:hypothetical protein